MTRDLLLIAEIQPDGVWEVPEGIAEDGLNLGVLLSLPFWGGIVWFLYWCTRVTI